MRCGAQVGLIHALPPAKVALALWAGTSNRPRKRPHKGAETHPPEAAALSRRGSRGAPAPATADDTGGGQVGNGDGMARGSGRRKVRPVQRH